LATLLLIGYRRSRKQGPLDAGDDAAYRPLLADEADSFSARDLNKKGSLNASGRV